MNKGAESSFLTYKILKKAVEGFTAVYNITFILWLVFIDLFYHSVILE